MANLDPVRGDDVAMLVPCAVARRSLKASEEFITAKGFEMNMSYAVVPGQ